MELTSRFRLAGIPVVAALVGGGLLLAAHDSPVHAQGPTQRHVDPRPAAESVNFTVAQHLAQQRAKQEAAHTPWRKLTWSRRMDRIAELGKRSLRAMTAAVTATSEPGTASFEGNLTVVSGPAGQAVGLQRQGDCSLRLLAGSYTVSLTSPTIQVLTETSNYERTLHDLAGLTTTPGTFAQGCDDATAGIGSRRAVYLGRSPQDLYLFAGTGHNPVGDNNALYVGTVDTGTQTAHSFNSDAAVPGINGVAAGDLDEDGLADVVGIDYFDSASIGVWLAQADGTMLGPTNHPLPGAGDRTSAALTTDVDGDDNLDVVVATRDSASNQEYVSVLLGQGNGTLGTPQSMAVPAPSGSTAIRIVNLIAVDLRNSGHPDVVASNGLVLLNHEGDGTFTVGAFAFPPTSSTSSYGPNLAAGDFNNDDDRDLAVNNGVSISLYTGDGTGGFTAGRAYASITDVGYVTASDLDGDGNVDLYVGMANGGFFGGDQFLANQVYALMGNGDGSFRGAPTTPFVYTGTNLANLDAGTDIDAIAVNPDLSFTSYIGDGTGHFNAHATLDVSPLTLFGRNYDLRNIESLAIGDIDGDEHADLLFLAEDLYVRPPVGFDAPGIVFAPGDGAGGFATPDFIGSGPFVPTTGGDSGQEIASLRLLDANHDGKPDLVFSYRSLDYTTSLNYAGIAVQLGNGDGTFGDAQTLVLYSGAATTTQTFKVVATTDLNDDANQDLLVMVRTTTFHPGAGQQEYELRVALGQGDGTFDEPVAVAMNDVLPGDYYIGRQYVPLAVEDMNGDARLDLVTLGASSSGSLQLAIALGNGDGTFRAANKTTYSAAYLGQDMGVGDLNGDDKLDVFVASASGPPDSAVTFGNGDGTLQPITGAGSGTVGNELVYLSIGGATVAADFNGDDRTDVLTGSTLLLSKEASTPPPDFEASASSLAGAAAAGNSVETTITFTPSSGFTGDITLSCSGLPEAASCEFDADSISVSSGPVSTTLTISTTERMAQLGPASGPKPLDPWMPGGAMLAGVLPFAVRRWSNRRQAWRGAGAQMPFWRERSLWRAAFLLAGIAFLYSCGGGGDHGSGSAPPPPTGTPAGTYDIAINATSGATTHTLKYRLTVT